MLPLFKLPKINMKALIKIFFNLLLGAIIFFAGVYYASSEDIMVKNENTENSFNVITPNMPDYSEDIKGTWAPVQVAKGTLSFQYGVLHHHTKSEYGSGYVDREYPYSVKGAHLILDNEYPGVHGIKNVLDLPIKIYEEGGIKYMEINDVPGFSGKYKKTR